jgi:quinol monooxygenase YgiN
MYGTVARMMLKPGKEAEMTALMRQEEEEGFPGHRGTIIYRSDKDPNEVYLATVFESKEAYVANANSPEMHQRYLRYRELLTAEPEWHDGEIVHMSVHG